MTQTEWLDYYALALRRWSLMMLDNLGISVNISKLPSAAALRLAEQEYVGSGKMGLLWRRVLYRFFPEIRKERLEKIWAYQQATQAELMYSVLEQGKVIMDGYRDD